VKVPSCAGTYEPGNVDCDGGGRKREKPCAWRDGCRDFKDWCADQDVDREEAVAGCESIEALEARMRGVDLDEETGQAKGTLAQVFAREEARAVEIPVECWQLHLHWENLLRDRFGDARVYSHLHRQGIPKVVVTPGSFYPVDRAARSRYVVWYCKAERGLDVGLAVVHLVATFRDVAIQLPFDEELLRKRLSAATLSKLRPEGKPDGQFKTICRRLGHEGVGLAVGVVQKLVERGDYELPKYEG